MLSDDDLPIGQYRVLAFLIAQMGTAAVTRLSYGRSSFETGRRRLMRIAGGSLTEALSFCLRSP